MFFNSIKAISRPFHPSVRHGPHCLSGEMTRQCDRMLDFLCKFASVMRKLVLLLALTAAVFVAQGTTRRATTAGHLSATAQRLAKAGYTNVQDADPSIKVSLMYSRADNFTGTVLYSDLREAYLHPKAAKALAKAQARLRQLRPGLSLKVYDAARPMSIQQVMWDKVKNTPKDIYVSNPAHGGGMHNYGLAVDITICDEHGDTLDMGTKIDYMGREAHIDAEATLVAQHRISSKARANRRLLREVMTYGGFMPLRTEWWHFNLVSRATAKKYYKVIK